MAIYLSESKICRAEQHGIPPLPSPQTAARRKVHKKKEYIIYTLLHSGKILKSVVRSNSLTLVAGSIGEQRYLVRLWRGRCEGLQQVGLEVCIVVLPPIMCYNNIKFLLQARRIVLAASCRHACAHAGGQSKPAGHGRRRRPLLSVGLFTRHCLRLQCHKGLLGPNRGICGA